MRPSQNKRMRGRNNNRKGPNPLSRNFESNGPDVKIRGTAHHIGEKYLQLARDAQSGGDPVMAESYLQHAEHYFRLIAAAQQAQQAQFGYQRQGGEAEVEELEEEDDFVAMPDRFASPIERAAQPAQQPFVNAPAQMPGQEQRERPPYANGDRQGYERQGYERQGGYQERGNRQDRNMDRQDRPDRNDRNVERGERPYQDKRGAPRDNRDNNGEGRGQRGRGGRDFRQDYRHDYRQEGRGEPRAPAEDIASPGLPAFITAPVRSIQQEPVSDEGADYVERSELDSDAPGFHLRPRRRRRPKQDIAMGDGSGESASAHDPVGD
jgi:Domain of unknown function (DUF4167)